MSRTADYAIQGFIYQFIITLHKLLESAKNAEITVEGIVEDIDIATPMGYEAIQCKYHESKSKFVLSSIYKPVLQMLCHYRRNPKAKIKYRLHAHFPNEKVGTKKKLNEAELQSILASTASDLETYINELKGFTKAKNFLKVFEIEFGASLEDSEKAVIVLLSKEGFSTEDASEIFYPNAIHEIAQISIRHNESNRKIKKSSFIQVLKEKKKTAISRWTKELASYEQLLKKRRKQLSDVLNKNMRVRMIVLDSEYINDFESKTPGLIYDYVMKYNSKIKLNKCPIFSIKGDEKTLNNVWKVLNNKKIDVQRGWVADSFDVKRFLKEPVKSIKEGTVEFKLRLCNHDKEFDQVLKEANIDDLIVVSNKDFSYEGYNFESLQTPEVSEIKYILSLNKTI